MNKYLSEAGYCSRREADRLIADGKVQIDGQTALMGQKVLADQQVTVNGQLIRKEEEPILLVVYKPAGIICTTQEREQPNIIRFLNYPKRIYPIGRLDKESEGLLLMTNQGELVNKMMRAGNYHEKEYIVKVNKPVTEVFIAGMSAPVPILDTMTRPCRVKKLGEKTFQIILTQGLNRQIRRMCEYFGYQVVTLKRVRIMNISLGGLKKGSWREITEKEWRGLQKLIQDSYTDPVQSSADGGIDE